MSWHRYFRKRTAYFYHITIRLKGYTVRLVSDPYKEDIGYEKHYYHILNWYKNTDEDTYEYKYSNGCDIILRDQIIGITFMTEKRELKKDDRTVIQ